MPDDELKSPAELPAAREGEYLTPGSGLPPQTAAGYASLLMLPGGVVFYILDRKDAYVRYYAIQSMVLSAVALLIKGVVWLGTTVFGHIYLVGWFFTWIMEVAFAIFMMGWFVVYIIATVSAFRGKKWHLPYLTMILKRFASRIP